MSKATITYSLSQAGQKQSILQGGDGKQQQVLGCDITPELLKIAKVKASGEVYLEISSYTTLNITLVEKKGWEPSLRKDGANIYFDAPQTSESLITWETERQDRIAAQMAELEPRYKQLMVEYESGREAAKSERDRVEAQRDAEQKAAREALEAEKRAWILEHGSEYLRDAVSLDYDCQRLYVTDRAALEHPDFDLDFDNNADWSSRSCPSIEALTIVKPLVAAKLDAQVVWLTEGVEKSESNLYDDDESCEAIVIRDYLGKYDLVKII